VTAGQGHVERPSPSTAPSVPTRFYRPELDGLRFVSFLMVFVAHSVPQHAIPRGMGDEVYRWTASAVRAGGFGVDVFLVLSAFLITELLMREHAHSGRIRVVPFWIRRALRIWPVFFLYLAVHAIVPRLFGTAFMGVDALLTFVFFAGNWTSAVVGPTLPLANHLWTICLEEQFYLAWPLLLSALGRTRWILAGLGAVAVAWLARGVLVRLAAPSPWLWVSTPARLDTFGLGAILALTLARTDFRLGTRAVLLACLASFGTLIVVTRYMPPTATPTTTWTSVGLGLTAIAATVLVGAIVRDDPGSAIRRLLTSRAMVSCGKVSYGAYVYHEVCIEGLAWLSRRGGFPIPPLLHVTVALALTLGASFASYRLLETPFLRLKDRWTIIPSRPV